MKRKNTPNITDVAKKAGVSPATVSRVIGNRKLVKADTVEKVNDAINTLHYSKSRSAGRSRNQKMVTVVVPDIQDPFFHILLKGISDIARVHKYCIILSNSDNSKTIEQENLELAVEQNIDGIIIIPSNKNVELFDSFIEHKIDVVFLDRIIERDDICYVISDDEEGAYQAAKYLLHLGHRDILYVGGDSQLSTEKNRLKGFKKALMEFGIPIGPELIRECSFSSETIYHQAQKIIKSNLNFSAVFSASDLIGFGVIKALEDLGKSVPEDISLVGYGDMPFSNYISLTTVSSPAYEMGKNAMLLLMDLIEGRRVVADKVVLRPSIVFRSSCRQKPE